MSASRRLPRANDEKDAKAVTTQPDVVSSEVLLGRAQELRIMHEGREYHLRRTRNGRLILTA